MMTKLNWRGDFTCMLLFLHSYLLVLGEKWRMGDCAKRKCSECPCFGKGWPK